MKLDAHIINNSCSQCGLPVSSCDSCGKKLEEKDKITCEEYEHYCESCEKEEE